MPTAENPFEDVYDEKDWAKARDKTGAKSGLTEKVSIGKELKLFHSKKDVQAALHLLEKFGIYEQVLNNKHKNEKYYRPLLKVVDDQKRAVQSGMAIIENVARIQETRNKLVALASGVDAWKTKIEDMVDDKEDWPEYKNRFRAISERARELKDLVPKDATTIGNDVVAKVVQLEKDLEKLKSELLAESDEGDEKTPAQRHWDRAVSPYLASLIGAAVSKVNGAAGYEIIASGPHGQLLDGLLLPVREKYAREYDAFVVKELDDSMKPKDDLTRGWAELANRLINDAVKQTLEQKKTTRWFEYEPQQTHGPKKKPQVEMNPNESLQLGDKTMDVVPGVRSEEEDSTKHFPSLLQSVAKFKDDPQKVGRFLQAAPTIIFGQRKSWHEPLKAIGAELVAGAKSVQMFLEKKPADLDQARAKLTETRQKVAQGCEKLPENGNVLMNALEQFALKTLENEINAKAGG
jgi:hypothetical protein